MASFPRVIRWAPLLALWVWAFFFAADAHAVGCPKFEMKNCNNYTAPADRCDDFGRFQLSRIAGIRAEVPHGTYYFVVTSGPTMLGDPATCFTTAQCNVVMSYQTFRKSDNGLQSTTTDEQQIYRGDGTGDQCTPPPPPGCNDDVPANQKHLIAANDKADSWLPPDDVCTPGGCKMIRVPNKYHRLGPSGARDYLLTYQGTGEDCTGTPTTPQPKDTETCVGPWCRSENSSENCGYVNNEAVCLDRVEPDRCQRLPSGAMVCADDAPTPPKPDNGTPGHPAAPTETIEACTGANSCQTSNYYTSSQVTNSSRDPPTGSNPDGSGTVGPDGPVIDEQEDDGSASGGVTCDAPPSCSGDPVQCAVLEQQWRARCVDAPASEDVYNVINATEDEIAGTVPTQEIDGSIESEASPIAGGSCPAPISITVWGHAMSVDVWSRGCEMAAMFAPIVLALSYLAGALILYRSV